MSWVSFGLGAVTALAVVAVTVIIWLYRVLYGRNDQ